MSTENPSVFALQVLGSTTLVASIATVPVLGALGFSTLGPVAGSTAAAWQASLGLVPAGSLFAFCQSVAMGGASVSTIMTTGAVGGVAAVAPMVRRGTARMAGAAHNIATTMPQVILKGMGRAAGLVKEKWCAFWK